jgi:hypothetical protein
MGTKFAQDVGVGVWGCRLAKGPLARAEKWWGWGRARGAWLGAWAMHRAHVGRGALRKNMAQQSNNVAQKDIAMGDVPCHIHITVIETGTRHMPHNMESNMTIHNIARVFAKRETAKSDWSGRIGAVEMVADVASIKVNGNDLGTASIDYLLNFSLQSLQDAYAGAESLVEAEAAWQKKLDALIEGTIGVRSGGGGMSDEERAELYVAEAVYAAVHKKGTEKGDAFRALDGDDKYEFIVGILPKVREQVKDFEDRVAARVETVVENRKRRAAEKAELAAMGAIDL